MKNKKMTLKGTSARQSSRDIEVFIVAFIILSIIMYFAQYKIIPENLTVISLVSNRTTEELQESLNDTV